MQPNEWLSSCEQSSQVVCAFYSTVFVLEFPYLVFLQPITSTLILIVTWLRLVGQKKKTLDRRKFTTERGRKIKFPSLSFFDSLDCFQRRDKLSTCTSWNMDSYQLHLHRNWREIWDICEWGVKKTRAHWQWNSFSGNIPSWMYEEKFGKKKIPKKLLTPQWLCISAKLFPRIWLIKIESPRRFRTAES